MLLWEADKTLLSQVVLCFPLSSLVLSSVALLKQNLSHNQHKRTLYTQLIQTLTSHMAFQS